MIYSKYDDIQDTSLSTDTDVMDFTPEPLPADTNPGSNAGGETADKTKPPLIGDPDDDSDPDGKPDGDNTDDTDNNGDKKFVDKIKDNFKEHKTIYLVVLAIVILIAIYFFGHSQRWW